MKSFSKIRQMSHITIIYRVWYCISYGTENKLFLNKLNKKFPFVLMAFIQKNVCILTQNTFPFVRLAIILVCRYVPIGCGLPRDFKISNSTCLPIHSYWMQSPTWPWISNFCCYQKNFYWTLLATTVTIYKLEVSFLDLRSWQIVI